jgi:EAL domain-containing protein (putative c-di-GMP-specific phosphodiesterase class I)
MLATLAKAGVGAERFDIEVTETVLLGRAADQVAETLAQISRAGMRVALDDFGTGYASLTHLKQFPVHDIKIDRSFIRDLERDDGDAAITAAVIDLGRNLGLTVVGEGVETKGQAEFLRRRGCTLAQGYLFAKPMAASRVPWLLRNGVKAAAGLVARRARPRLVS